MASWNTAQRILTLLLLLNSFIMGTHDGCIIEESLVARPMHNSQGRTKKMIVTGNHLDKMVNL